MSESAQVEESRLCPSDPLQSSWAKQQQRLRLGRARMDVHMVCSSHASGTATPAFHLGSLCPSCSLLSKSCGRLWLWLLMVITECHFGNTSEAVCHCFFFFLCFLNLVKKPDHLSHRAFPVWNSQTAFPWYSLMFLYPAPVFPVTWWLDLKSW